MNDPLRLAYLSLETPKAGQASKTHIEEIIANLRDAGWVVELFATSQGGASTGSSFSKRLVDYSRVQFALARRMAAFDAVFVRSHFMAAPLVIWAGLRRVPVVHEVNGKPSEIAVTYPALRTFAPVLTWLYRLQYRSGAHLFAVTEGLGNWAKSFAGHDRVSVVSNGANTRLFKPDGPSGSIEGRYVVFVGGLVGWHGIDTMLAALREPVWPPDVRLVIVGDGIERHKVQQAAVDPRLIWLGRQPYQAVPAIVRGALAALCMIEDRDGRSASGVAPLKLFEAMACGVPVIASDIPFQADIVRSIDAGVIVPPASPPAVAAAVRRFANCPEEAKAAGRNGATYVAREASWQHRARTIDRLMRTVVQSARSA